MLLPADYLLLKEQGQEIEELPDQRFLIFKDFQLPEGVYTVEKTNVMVILEKSYPDAGHDMFWLCPILSLVSGMAIPQADNSIQNVNGVNYYRWSRHWNEPHTRWQPGKSDVNTIIRRLKWALHNPMLLKL